MRATYCKVKKILTVKMSLDQYYDICDETENGNRNRVYDLIDAGDRAITTLPEPREEDITHYHRGG